MPQPLRGAVREGRDTSGRPGTSRFWRRRGRALRVIASPLTAAVDCNARGDPILAVELTRTSRNEALPRQTDRRAFLTRIGALAGLRRSRGWLVRPAAPPQTHRLPDRRRAGAHRRVQRRAGERGYIEGKSLDLELRGSRPALRRRGTRSNWRRAISSWLSLRRCPQALEIRKANPAMPMVIATCPGMISNGFAQSLDHPGGNVTGMDELPPE